MESGETMAEKAETLKHLKSLMQTPGWSKLLGRLEKLSTLKEVELRNLLRAPSNEKMLQSIRMQGFIDGLNAIKDETKRMVNAAESEINP